MINLKLMYFGDDIVQLRSTKISLMNQVAELKNWQLRCYRFIKTSIIKDDKKGWYDFLTENIIEECVAEVQIKVVQSKIKTLTY